MTSTDAYWAAVERRGRRTELLTAPLLATFFTALVALRGGEFGFWEGRAAWVAVAVLVAIAVVVQVLAHAVPRMRRRQLEAHRLQHALRRHVDPGPELRSKVDQQARYLAGISWAVWVFPVGLLGLLVGARWDRPATTVPAVLVVVAAFAAIGVNFHRQTTAARRWVADPPGPPRDPPPAGRAERWMTGVRPLLVLTGIVLVPGLATGLAIRLAD